jgi:hypothetical protein
MREPSDRLAGAAALPEDVWVVRLEWGKRCGLGLRRRRRRCKGSVGRRSSVLCGGGGGVREPSDRLAGAAALPEDVWVVHVRLVVSIL